MPSIQFPDIQLPEYGLKINREDNIIRSKMENGIQITRRKYTKIRKTFELSWTALPEEDRNTLISFYETYAASSFTWTNPAEEVSYTVRFAEPIEESLNNFKLYNITCKLQEV